MNEPTLVRLKNGTEAPEVAVRAIMLSLEDVLNKDPIAFYELTCIVQDAAHQPFGQTGQHLRNRGLIERDGQPHELVRDVVRSAITGEGFDLQLVSPFTEEG